MNKTRTSFHFAHCPSPLASRPSPQVKICGLTRVDEALACAELGAHAIGCVFYPRSPRCVSEEQARRIVDALPDHVLSVGVFVDESVSTVLKMVEHCGLRAVQLHGLESPQTVEAVRREGVVVIKALFVNKAPALDTAGSYTASAFLVECAGGTLPGGNALVWDWSKAREISEAAPVILAGGLNPENIARAIAQASPDAVDVSSGVEVQPGRKDIHKVKHFLEAVARSGSSKAPRRIFR